MDLVVGATQCVPTEILSRTGAAVRRPYQDPFGPFSPYGTRTAVALVPAAKATPSLELWNQQISALRKALAQNGGTELSETVARCGYRFVGPTREVGGAPSIQSVGENGGPHTPAASPFPVILEGQPCVQR